MIYIFYMYFFMIFFSNKMILRKTKVNGEQ